MRAVDVLYHNLASTVDTSGTELAGLRLIGYHTIPCAVCPEGISFRRLHEMSCRVRPATSSIPTYICINDGRPGLPKFPARTMMQYPHHIISYPCNKQQAQRAASAAQRASNFTIRLPSVCGWCMHASKRCHGLCTQQANIPSTNLCSQYCCSLNLAILLPEPWGVGTVGLPIMISMQSS